MGLLGQRRVQLVHRLGSALGKRPFEVGRRLGGLGALPLVERLGLLATSGRLGVGLLT